MGPLMRDAYSILGPDAGLASVEIGVRSYTSDGCRGEFAAASQLLCGGDAVNSQHAIRLQDVVGKRMQEHDRSDFDFSAHSRAALIPFASSRMHALAALSALVPDLVFVTPHSASQSEHTETIVGSRLERI